MQYEYVNETMVPIKMTITYRELVLLDKLLSKDVAEDWRYDEMRESVKNALEDSTEYMANYFKYQHKHYQFTKETDNA